jgi:hypothetical protein
MSDEYSAALKGIPGNIVVFTELYDFFITNDVNVVKKNFLKLNKCLFPDSWLWYIFKNLNNQDINKTKEYLQNLMNQK